MPFRRSAFLIALAALPLGCSSTGPSQLDGEWNEPTSESPHQGGRDAGSSSDPMPVSNADAGPTQPPVASSTPVVDGLSVDEVAAFQTVKVPLMKAGSAASAVAPLVAGRAALVRAYVTPSGSWTSHPIQGQLTIDSGGQKTTLAVDASPTAASTEGALASTINFEVPGERIGVDAKFSLVLREKSGSKAPPSTSNAAWPRDLGFASFGAVATGPQLKVVLVPIAYGADGSNRLPDLSSTQLQKYKDLLYALYPAPSVSVTVRAQPFPVTTNVTASGNGWSQLLTQVLGLRAQDAPSADVYYYGVFAPSSSFQGYCPTGCVVGLSPIITNAADSANRASIGVGFSGDIAAESLVHELGHAHGRSHAPCGGVAGPDPGYPYGGGALGSWGYSLVSKTLKDPSQYKDLMGYCNPGWFSDYSEKALITRVKTVNGAQTVAMPPRKFHYATLEENGDVTWVSSASLTSLPGGEPRTVIYEAQDGSTIGTDTAYVLAHDHLKSATIIAPDGPLGTARMRLAGQTVKFAPKL